MAEVLITQRDNHEEVYVMFLVNFIIDNWPFIGAAIAFVIGGFVSARKFLLQPSSRQIEQILQWLLWAVTEAEGTLGSGTGKLKLSRVYEKFVIAFPWLARIVTVDLFGELVDESIDTLRDMLQNNPCVAAVASGEKLV